MDIVLCFIYADFADFEMTLVCSGIRASNRYEVRYIAYEKLPVRSCCGLSIIPDKTVNEITQTKGIAGIIFPGGNDIEIRPELEKLVKSLAYEKKLIAAICAGPEFLAKMSLLEDVKYTTSNDSKYYLEKNERDPFPRNNYVDTRIVKDDNFITAKGNAFLDFALEIWDWYNLYDTNSEKEETRQSFIPL